MAATEWIATEGVGVKRAAAKALSEHKGRGALSNEPSRFEKFRVEQETPETLLGDEQDWDIIPTVKTEVRTLKAKSIISRNQSPDIPFSQSINPYQGCEHGCIYCFARPTHSYLDLSPGLDFETRLVAKPNAAELLEQALLKPGYRCTPIAMGTNTDPYQPIEKEHRITRQILEVLQRYQHPVSIVTKSSLILRDLDILEDMARSQLCSVFVSITTLNNDLKRKLEPRTASPGRRLHTLQALKEAGVPVGVMAAPMIPTINDQELEAILKAAHQAGALRAGYILLRLPHEVKELFHEWLSQHYPGRTQHVMSIIRQSRGGRLNDPAFGQRMRGKGFYADMLEQRFQVACRKLGLNQQPRSSLNCQRFNPQQGFEHLTGQMNLF